MTRKRKMSNARDWFRRGAFYCGVDHRGRITLPKRVREYMHLEAGDWIELTIHPIGKTRMGTGIPDQYCAMLSRAKGKISKDTDLQR
jgi:AbrB family looped-hinge helix DNA binding protein